MATTSKRLFAASGPIGNALLSCLSRSSDGRYFCERWDLPRTEVRLKANFLVEADWPDGVTLSGPERFIEPDHNKRQNNARFSEYSRAVIERAKQRQTKNLLVDKT